MHVAATSGRRTDYRLPEPLFHYHLHFVGADVAKNGQSAEMLLPFAGFGIAVLQTI